MTWDDLRIFLAVHRRKSYGGAARLLGVAPTTIGRRIAALEASLAARLFDRTRAGLAITAEGAALIPHAERVEHEILAAERELGGADARLAGTVRLTASDGIVQYVLIPALAALRRKHPGIVVELRADTRALDLSRREADVAVRLTRPTEPALVARRFGTLRFGLYASAAYLERRGAPRTAGELDDHELVGFDASLDDLPQVRWLRKLVGDRRWAIRANSTVAQVAACTEGLGLTLLGTFVAAREPRLVPVLPSLQPPPRDAWVVVHEDVRRSARVTAVLAWLAREAPLGG